MQTQTEIRRLLIAAGLRPNRKLGQHFLIDGNLMRRLVASAEIHADDVVLEVGCGTGSLTQELAQVAGAVVAVEVDRGVAEIAAGVVDRLENACLLRCDVLQSKTKIDPEVLRAVSKARAHLSGDVLLVANLPYQVASPLIVDLLIEPIEVSRMCVTIQKEVGDRLTAKPGGKDYGPLGVIVQAMAEVRPIATLGPQAFWPKPAVRSVMIRIDPRPDRSARIGDAFHFVEVVKQCFTKRRKMLGNALVTWYDPEKTRRALQVCAIEATDRPERLDPTHWVKLAKALADA